MRIEGASQGVQQAIAATKSQEATKLSYQQRVLKRALESHKDQSVELHKLLDPKGRVIDIRA